MKKPRSMVGGARRAVLRTPWAMLMLTLLGLLVAPACSGDSSPGDSKMGVR